MSRYFGVLRHAERADYATTKRPQLVEGDPSLTELGLVQAEIAAEKVISELPKCDSLCILSSPFLRCVETASILARKLGVPILIEEGLSELMMPKYFESDILDRVVSKTQPELIEKELGVKIVKGILGLKPDFPETRCGSVRRTIHAWDSIFSVYSEYQCIIVVTHLFAVNELFKYWTNEEESCDSGYCKFGLSEYKDDFYIPTIIPSSGYLYQQY